MNINRDQFDQHSKRLWISLCLITANLVFSSFAIAEEEMPSNLGLLFTPVREEFVDELPETVKEFPISSMMPIVFRGAAKNWGAMKWTPESLAEMGFDKPRKVFGTNDRGVDVLYVENYQGERNTSNEKLDSLFKRDTNYTEDYNYSPEFYPKGVKSPRFKYVLFAGGPGASQIMFDYHEGVLLAEFYGEKLVFLMAPGHFDEDSKHSQWITNALKKYTKDGLTMKEAMMKIIDSENWDELIKTGEEYSPRQRTILRPGDILYIPAAWAHRVFYLNDSIGATQVIEADDVNWGK